MGDTMTTVLPAMANDSEQPLRVVGIAVAALDADGFVYQSVATRKRDVTGPQGAKDKVTLDFNNSPGQLAMVRAWGRDLRMPD